MLVRDSITYLLARAVAAIFSLSSIAVLTRLLSADAYGQYALILAATGLLNAIFFSWNTQSVFRFYAAHQTDLSKLLTSGLAGFVLSFLATAVVAGLLVAIIDFHITAILFAAGLMLVIAMAWLDLTVILLNAQHRAKAYVALQFGRAAVSLAAGGLAAWITHSAAAVVLATAVSLILFSVLTKTFRGWLRDVNSAAFSRPLMLQLFHYGYPLSITLALMQVLGTADRFMLAHYSNTRDVGAYAAGFDLSQYAIGAIGGALSLSFYPRILALLEAEGEDAARGHLKIYGSVQVAILLPVAVGLAIVSPAVTNLLIGPELRNTAASIMPWICAGTFFGVIKAYYTDFAFQIGKWTQGGILIAGFTVIINLGLNFFLIPLSGALGAGQASLISFILSFVASVLLGHFRGFRLAFPWGDFGRVFLAATGMALILLPYRQHTSIGWLLGQIVMGAASYGVLCYGLNVLNIRTLARGSWRRLGIF